jgi:SAM-dependent methyltransferase
VRDAPALARLVTDLVVRWPPLWRVLRRPLRRMFDGLAPAWGLQRRPGYHDALEAALDALPEPPLDVLDLGTGTGSAALLVARRWPTANVTGVDVSPGMVAQRAGPNLCRWPRAFAQCNLPARDPAGQRFSGPEVSSCEHPDSRR